MFDRSDSDEVSRSQLSTLWECVCRRLPLLPKVWETPCDGSGKAGTGARADCAGTTADWSSTVQVHWALAKGDDSTCCWVE